MKFAEAVDALIARSGPWLRPMILGRGGVLRRAQVMALASRKPKEQTALLKQLRVTGKLPRGLDRGHRATIAMPREPEAMVNAMISRLGKAELAQVARLLRSRGSKESKQGEVRENKALEIAL
jgi:hypothetical protein